MAKTERIRPHEYTGCCRSCGTVVYRSPTLSGRPMYQETVLCPNCGRDCSRRPFPGYHIWWLRHRRYLYRKRLRAWRWQLRNRWLPEFEETLRGRFSRGDKD